MNPSPQENTAKTCLSDERQADKFATTMTVLADVANGETLAMAIDNLAVNGNQSRLQIAMAVSETFAVMRGELQEILDLECQKEFDNMPTV